MPGDLIQKLQMFLMLGMVCVACACGDSELYYAELEGTSSGEAVAFGQVARAGEMLSLQEEGHLLFEGAEVASTFEGVAVPIRSLKPMGQLIVAWEGETRDIYFRVPNPLEGEASWSRLTQVNEVGNGFMGHAFVDGAQTHEVELYIEDVSQVGMIMIESAP